MSKLKGRQQNNPSLTLTKVLLQILTPRSEDQQVMAENRKSWNSVMAEELLGEAIDKVVTSVEGTVDDKTVAEMLAAKVEKVRRPVMAPRSN